jgi:hypothetical protein
MFYLHQLDNYAFEQWVKRSGFDDELDFWSSLSGLSSGTVYDHMDEYLGYLGYTGDTGDKLRTFIIDQVGNIGTTFDNANEMFLGSYSTAEYESGVNILTEDGDFLVTEDGDTLVTE